MDNIIVDDKLVEAFHLMYDSFPGVAQLNHKSKLVVAVNPAAHAFGRLEGTICSRHGSPDQHKSCLADRALIERKEQSVCMPPMADGTEMTVFWLPIEGHPDYYIHFASVYKSMEP
ncbi:hypothetical protein LJB86_04620 [Deltaproteobacteria bacterium OttesenSCG-928-M10]|nr:hypothetical protein [Deltaproteobacteria bacterium OttesenSCG-928-M10]